MSALLKKIANSSLDLTLCKRRYSLELCNLLASLIHKQTRCRPALNQVMQLEIHVWYMLRDILSTQQLLEWP